MAGFRSVVAILFSAWASCADARGHTAAEKDNKQYMALVADNETNETELLMFKPKGPAPAPAVFTISARITSAVGSKPSDAAVQTSIANALPGVEASRVTVTTEFEITQEITIEGVSQAEFTETVACAAVAEQYSVSASAVSCELVWSRRLSSRRLAAHGTNVALTTNVKTTDATKADTINAAAADTASAASGFKKAYETAYTSAGLGTVTLPTPVAKAPTMDMNMKFSVTQIAGQQESIEAPTAATFLTTLKETQTTLGEPVITVDLADIAVETPMPTMMPTIMPTLLPGDTSMPTVMPTAAPPATPAPPAPTPAPPAVTPAPPAPTPAPPAATPAPPAATPAPPAATPAPPSPTPAPPAPTPAPTNTTTLPREEESGVTRSSLAASALTIVACAVFMSSA